MERRNEAIKIIALGTVASIVYGIVHDQVTARLCLEYFTVWHPHITDAKDPTTVAIVWGTAASWWMGLILSVPLALASVLGQEPILKARQLVKPISFLLLAMALGALVGGLIAYRTGYNAGAGLIRGAVTPDRYPIFSTVYAAHLSCYLVAVLGGIGLWIYAALKRHSPVSGT